MTLRPSCSINPKSVIGPPMSPSCPLFTRYDLTFVRRFAIRAVGGPSFFPWTGGIRAHLLNVRHCPLCLPSV
jgi:hypothetical protein